MVYKVPFVNYPEHYRRMWNEVIDARAYASLNFPRNCGTLRAGKDGQQ